MATPQNLRVLQWIGEAYDSGSGNTRTAVIGGTPVPMVAAPNIQSISFYVPSTVNNWFVQSPNSESFIRSRTEKYWFNLIVTMTINGSAVPNITVSVPPLSTVWLPPNITAITSITGGNAWDGNQGVQTAGTQLSFLDYIVIT